MDDRPRLITIPVSHYCEKARWTLDSAGISYVERRYPPAIHRLAVMRHGARTAPILLAGRHVVRGSDGIVSWAAERPGGAHLLPEDAAERAEVERLLALFDSRLGIDSRRWLYSWVLDDVPAFTALLGSGLGERGRGVLARLHTPIRGLIRRAFRVRPGTRERAEEGIRGVFAMADAQRAGSPYLVGDRFTAADLAFAALSAPLVAPPGYGVELPAVEQLPGGFRDAIAGWRATPSGAAVLAVYERHRRGTARPTPTTPEGVPR